MRLPLLAILPVALLPAADTQHHSFTTGEHVVTMNVTFLDPYVGKRLVFYSTAEPGKEICALRAEQPGPCPERFVGAVATATFTIRRANGKAVNRASIRERVIVIAQSSNLPTRPPFEVTQTLNRGMITDVQVFGYEESHLPEPERAAARKLFSEQFWRLCRQELYLNGDKDPFAVIDWRHTSVQIEITNVEAKPLKY